MADDLPLTDEQVGIVAWRISQLTLVGVDPDVAGEIAAIPSLDLHQAVAMKELGCPQKLILKILSD